MYTYPSRSLVVRRAYRSILKASHTHYGGDPLTQGHIRIKARYIVAKFRDSHELEPLTQMYTLLRKLESRVHTQDKSLSAEAYGLQEESDIKHLWEWEGRQVP